MTPFKIKISIDYYEQLGNALKTGDTIYTKNKDENYSVYAQLINFETKTNCWLGKSATVKSFPVSKKGHYIEITVVPFDQYLKKMKDKGFR